MLVIWMHLACFLRGGQQCLQENYTPIDHINNWKENQKSPYFSKTDKKVINHIGEVRRKPCTRGDSAAQPERGGGMIIVFQS